MHRIALPIALLALVACGGEDALQHDGQGHDGHAAVDHAAHAPRMGGTLIELGEHELQLELVYDAQAGRLTVYVWDGHVEHPVRTAAASAPVVLDLDGAEVALALAARADVLTGETVGDSARFEVDDPRLKGLSAVSGRIGPIAIAGRSWGPVEFRAR